MNKEKIQKLCEDWKFYRDSHVSGHDFITLLEALIDKEDRPAEPERWKPDYKYWYMLENLDVSESIWCDHWADTARWGAGSPRWHWARLLKRVVALAMATCPCCHQGALRLLAAITQAEVIRQMLRPLTLAAAPPLMAPARARQATCDWVASAQPARVASGATCV